MRHKKIQWISFVITCCVVCIDYGCICKCSPLGFVVSGHMTNPSGERRVWKRYIIVFVCHIGDNCRHFSLIIEESSWPFFEDRSPSRPLSSAILADADVYKVFMWLLWTRYVSYSNLAQKHKSWSVWDMPKSPLRCRVHKSKSNYNISAFFISLWYSIFTYISIR